MRRSVVLTALATMLLCLPEAQAARVPSRTEADAIFRAIQQRAPTMPIACLPLRIRVSTADNRYAAVDEALACLRKGLWGDGLYLLHHTRAGWRVVNEGSEFPCSAAPASVLRDLRLTCVKSS